MKTITTIFISLLAFTGFAGTIDSKVEQVTIFLNQAQVTRTSNVKLSVGIQELVFTGISSRIDPNSIQIKGKGGFIILGTYYQRNYLNENELPSGLQALRDSVELLEKEIATIDNELIALKEEEELLKANKVLSGKNENLSVQELKEMVNYFRNRILGINNQKYGLEVEKREKREKYGRLKKQLQDRNNRFREVSGEIVVEVKANKMATGQLELSYLVSGASWRPEYDLRAESLDVPLGLFYKAIINQETGEDWKNVNLTLSTANPSVGGSVPEIYPWYLDFDNPVMYGSKRSKEEFSEPAMMAEMDMAEESLEAEDLGDYSSRVEKAISVNYEIEIPYTLISGQKPTTVAIRQQKIEADYLYQATPKLSNHVYLVAKAKNWNTLDLLPGEMNIFFDGGFVNKSYLNPEQTGEELSIALGVDRNIGIERKELKDLTKDQFIGSSRKIFYSYQITVINKKSSEIEVEIFDQVPVSKNADIEVEIEELSGAGLNKNTGKVSWKITVPALQQKDLKLAYEVKYPKEKKVPGL